MNKDEDLSACIQQIVDKQNLEKQRNQIQSIVEQLDMNMLDCAAALLYLRQPHGANSVLPAAVTLNKPKKTQLRCVRYRLDIGSQHQVDAEQIQAVLIAESGVDKKRIGKIDIRNDHTLVELPEGMPADIFQILSEASIGNRKLAIKRIKNKRKIIKQN